MMRREEEDNVKINKRERVNYYLFIY